MTTTSDEFVDTVRTDNKTALSRLGSSKALYADTEGAMSGTEVLHAAATAEFHARETFEEWTDSEEHDSAHEVFETTAAEEGDHYGLVVERLEGEHEPGETPAIQEFLRAQTDTIGRAGAFLGRTIATDESKSQLVGFFVGQADRKGADLFREIGGDVDDQLTRGKDLLNEVCDDETDWERARAAAGGAIGAAYDEYTNTLEGLGVNPKPVC